MVKIQKTSLTRRWISNRRLTSLAGILVIGLVCLFTTLIIFRITPSDESYLLTGGVISAPASSSKKWDSSKCAVIALAAGYSLDIYQVFVGSLRATGYNGHIILGVAPNISPDAQKYLEVNNVTTKTVKLAKKCTYYNYTQHNGNPLVNQKCAEAYPDYKIQWGRFPLAMDWLNECKECTDGVMLTDTRDAYFQSDPFQAVTDPANSKLMLFEEIFPNVTTEHWLTDIPVKLCRNYKFGPKPMICSGSTMGSREGILEYIKVMVEEFDYWKDHKECRSDMVGDDQSIHNYLYYSGRLPNAVAIPHRTGPIHVVGVEANIVFREVIKQALANGHGKDLNEAEGWVNANGFHGEAEEKNWRDWMPSKYNLIDPKTGYVLNFDGKPSPQVHQFDRFGMTFYRGTWMKNMLKEWTKKNM